MERDRKSLSRLLAAILCCVSVLLLLASCIADGTPEMPETADTAESAQTAASDTLPPDFWGTGSDTVSEFPNEPESDYTKRY